jgi:D-tyrosyl-tRNA(Tyr) deacylase
VVVGDRVASAIGTGLLVYVGVDRGDGDDDAAYLADKIRYLRVFSDENGRMNLDVCQINGRVLVVSAFTVQADARHGRRPSFDEAAAPEQALVHYESLCKALQTAGADVQRGCFGETMQVDSVNDGPVCVLLESRRLF